MSWNGFVALGTLTANVFTESAATGGYARAAFTFPSPVLSKLQGAGANITFTATSAVVTTYNAYAFYSASTGGNPILVYPVNVTYSFGLVTPYVLDPYQVIVDLVSGLTFHGLTVDLGGAAQLAGTQPYNQNWSSTTGITAHAGGTQAAAVLLTAGINRVNTVATAGDSVALPAAVPGAVVVVINAATKAMQVFGSGTDTINGVATATGVSQPGNSVDVYFCATGGAWHAEVGEGYTGGLFTESVQDTITAHSGGGQSLATAITAQTARVTTVAAAGDSVKLPASAAGLELIVINSAALPMGVFGAGTDTIDNVATATGVVQMANSMCIYSCVTAGAWFSNGLGTGYSGSLPTVSYTNAITAFATGGQSSATPLTTVLNRVTVVASAADSVLLPVSSPGMQIVAMNAAAANSMNVFPATGESINALSANAAFAVAANKTVSFFCTVAGLWHALLSA